MSFLAHAAAQQARKDPPFTIVFQPCLQQDFESAFSAYQSISFMPAYQHWSFEEIRANDYVWGRKGGDFFQKNPQMAANRKETPESFGNPFKSGNTFNNFAPGSFGATSQAGAASNKSTFGTPKDSKPSSFGGSPGVFGASPSSSDATKTPFTPSVNPKVGLFGVPPSGVSAAEGPFGSSTNARPGLFGTASPGQGTARPQGSTFGQPKTGLFGAASSNNNSTSTQAKFGLFGATSASVAAPQTPSHALGGPKSASFGTSEFGDFVKPSTTSSAPVTNVSQVRSVPDETRNYETDIVVLKVGENAAKHFSVHEGVVKQRSDFVRDSFDKEPGEGGKAGPHVIHLPDVDPKVFSMYQKWLYSGLIPTLLVDLKPGSDEEYKMLVQAYILGGKLIDVDFKDTVVDAILEKLRATHSFDTRLTNLVFDKTLLSEQSPLRRLWQEVYYHFGTPEWLSVPDINTSFFIEFSKFQMFARARVDPRDCIFAPCRYHQHGDRPCYRERIRMLALSASKALVKS